MQTSDPQRQRVTRSLVLGAVLLVARSASAETPDEDKKACFAAVDAAQRLRIAHKLTSAREQLVQCARPVCPALFRNDCVQWLAEVEKAVPSVVFGAKDDHGQDLIDVQVLMDGARLAGRLDGTAVPVDPGPHVFQFTWEGRATLEERALIREGEKDRAITVSFSPAAPTPHAAPPAASIPAGVWILGALGVAGGAAFTGLYLSASSDVNNLRSTCAPACSSSDVDSARAKATAGYVSLGVGIASLGVAATWLLLSRAPSKEAGTVSIQPAPHGAAASFAFTF